MPAEPIPYTSALSDDPERRGRQLRNSIIFHAERTLLGSTADALVADVHARLLAAEGRIRDLKEADLELRLKTLNVLLANLAVAAFNRRNPRAFVALPMNSTDYANTGLSFTTIKLAFRTLPALGLAYGKRGEAKRDDGIGEWRGVLSRLRGNREMRALMKHHGLEPKHINNPPIELIKISDANWQTGPESARVTASRTVLERVNALLQGADLSLCDEAWARIRANRKRSEDLDDEERKHLQYLGNMTAKQLYRSFTEAWDRGGRLYGGWWMGVEKRERPLIQIDGETTVELDYGQLQPTLLFARIGRELTYDPYRVPGYARELGKDWFMRLLNQTQRKGGGYIKRAKDAPLPPDTSAEEYTRLFKQHLAPISHFFGNGMGLNLQCEDSELALAVLDRLAAQGIVAMPIHDSFIVRRTDEAVLRAAMIDCFRNRYQLDPVIKPPAPT